MKCVSFILEYCTQQNVRVIAPPFTILTWKSTSNDLSKIFKSSIILIKWARSSEFVYSSIPSWQILTAHAQPFRGARDLAFCLKVPLDSLLVWVSSEGSVETARMRRLAWTFAARIGDKYQIRLMRSKWYSLFFLPQVPVLWKIFKV